MTTANTARGRAARPDRTIAQWGCLIIGATLVLAGILGFLVDAGFDIGDGVSGDRLIVFEVNGIHNLVHIGSGLLLLAMANVASTAKLGLIAFGVVYALVTVIGLIDGNDVLGLIPVNGADNVLHLALTAAALGLGLAAPGRRRAAV